MVRKEYWAYTYEEAIEMAKKDGYTVIKEKTTSWRKAGSPITDRAFRAFAGKVILDEQVDGAPGIGFMIRLENGNGTEIAIPSTFRNVKVTKSLTKERCYEWYRADNGELVLSIANATKKEALKMGREAIKNLKTNLVLTIVYRIVENDGIVGYLDYTPSNKSKLGRFLFFGNEAPDIF